MKRDFPVIEDATARFPAACGSSVRRRGRITHNGRRDNMILRFPEFRRRIESDDIELAFEATLLSFPDEYGLADEVAAVLKPFRSELL
jgi:hypothetical protein